MSRTECTALVQYANNDIYGNHCFYVISCDKKRDILFSTQEENMKLIFIIKYWDTVPFSYGLC